MEDAFKRMDISGACLDPGGTPAVCSKSNRSMLNDVGSGLQALAR